MSTSDMRQIPFIVNEAVKLNPTTILDVGCGNGKYCFLLREYLETTKGNYKKSRWKKVIDAVEIYKPYIQSWHRAIYNDIYIENIMNLDIQNYDLILLCDILEHLLKDDAKKVLKKCLKHSKWVIISMPNGFMHQSATNGNEREEHLSGFKPNDFHGEVIYEDGDVFSMLLKGDLNGK